MRGKGLSLSLLILMQILFISVSSETPDDILVDGDLSDWGTDTLMGTDSNSVSFHLTWNSTHLSIAWDGTDWASTTEGADLFVYLNTSEYGTPLSKDWNMIHTLPFSSDYGFLLEDSSYFRLVRYNGTDWVEGNQEGLEAYVGHSSNKITEISIPWSNIGNPTSLDLVAWAQWEGAGNVWSSFPQSNPASSNGVETFNFSWHISDISVPTNPSSIPVVEAGVIEKLDNALNLAIIFHQHQPYYKNKLTDMYEMPWVRVHAMTEYVDSPGILGETDTKVTYNLVPSFLEQLLEYHNDNSTLDVHTDIAKRPWTEGSYPNATDLELHTMQFQSFWNSGWIYNVSQDDTKLGWLYPSSSRYSDLYDMTLHNLKPATIMNDELLSPSDFLDLQVLWYLYQFSPDYVLGNYNSSHRDQGLIDLFMQNGNYNHSDLMYVLDKQQLHMGNVLPMYGELARDGQVELTTTPYYHPIMPLLMQDGWQMEDGIRVNKDSWPDDVQLQLNNGMDLFESEIGFRPVGMWPSEQAVSPGMVEPVSDVGVEWMVTDEEILMKSTTGQDDAFVDVEIASQLTTPWITTGSEGGEVAVIFRDRYISDRIAFAYGKMTPEEAVTDFISYIDNMRQQLLDEGKNPSDHLLTVALDGENWMFMSEFQHQDNARPFMKEWYSRLSTHPSIITTTPSEFLEKNITLPHINSIGTGSWIDGTLRTWAGEPEESLAWQRLVEARTSLVDFELEYPTHPGLADAWESLYIAEGSDWYWWYGLDQDSGYDENWDVLFKVHLSNIYRAINIDLPPYLQELWTNPAIPESPYEGIIEPMIDGYSLPGEWSGAARYDAPVDGGDFDIESFYVGYDTTNVFVRIDAPNLTELESNQRAESPDLAIYFMEPNAVNFNEVQTNYRTFYGNDILGFPAKYMVAFNFNTIQEDGRAKWDLFSAQGKVGDNELWTLVGSSNLGGCASNDVYEFQIPWSEIGLAPRYSTRMKVVSAWTDSGLYGDGSDSEMAPPAPSETVLPDLEEWVTLLELEDAIGDETGDGDYVYPLHSDFSTPTGSGLWDARNVTIRQSAWNAQFIIGMGEMTDIWGLANGFSHQIVQIYVDKGPTEYGKTEMLLGANAEVHPEWAWEVALSGTGEPGAVQSVQAQTGSTSAKGMEVQGDVNTKTITFTVSKGVIGQEIGNYRYIIVIGSQDGFGVGKWRDVDSVPSIWTLGGGEEPGGDGSDYDPNIIDIILDGPGQEAMLSSYNVDEYEYAKITGFEIPEVPQQIYGFKSINTTSNSAIFEWSTTREANGTINCENTDNSTENNWIGTGLTHTLVVENLEMNTTYNCFVSIGNLTSEIIEVITSNVDDLIAPELLNLDYNVLEDGSVRITWYTSESATELLTLNGDIIHSDLYATKKNHEYIISNLSSGTWELVVVSADASNNSNSSSIIFVIENTEDVEDTATDKANQDKKESTQTQEKSDSEISQTMIFIVIFFIVGIVILALLRTRIQNIDDDERWN